MERISKFEDRNIEIFPIEEEWELRFLESEEAKKKSEEALWELSESIRRTNIRLEGIPEGEERKEQSI